MVTKKTIKLADLTNLSNPVAVSDTDQILLRGLNLREMVSLFMDSQTVFIPLLEMGLAGDFSPERFAPVLLASPEVVARIIALASDEPESAKIVETNMPATVQLIALHEVWKASVPDPKKAKELLSEVTALLQKLNDEGNAKQKLLQTTSPMPSPPA